MRMIYVCLHCAKFGAFWRKRRDVQQCKKKMEEATNFCGQHTSERKLFELLCEYVINICGDVWKMSPMKLGEETGAGLCVFASKKMCYIHIFVEHILEYRQKYGHVCIALDAHQLICNALVYAFFYIY